MTDAWTAYLLTLGEDVYRFLRSKGARKEDAEDSVQNTFYKVYASLDAWTPETVRPWFFRVALNDYIDTVRRKDEQTITWTEAVEATYQSEERGITQIVQLDEFESIMRGVKRADRELFLLKYYYDLTYEEIGEWVQKSPDAVKKQVYRVKQMIQQRRR
ncbi:MAG TPA: sigma-70 family RNA polymerase sigma factor [Savagea sp.]